MPAERSKRTNKMHRARCVNPKDDLQCDWHVENKDRDKLLEQAIQHVLDTGHKVKTGKTKLANKLVKSVQDLPKPYYLCASPDCSCWHAEDLYWWNDGWYCRDCIEHLITWKSDVDCEDSDEVLWHTYTRSNSLHTEIERRRTNE